MREAVSTPAPDGAVFAAEEFGRSEEARPMTVHLAGRGGARVLVAAGQHGDERRARRAVEDLWGTPGHLPTGLPVSLALVSDMNPDAAARKQRRNAAGIDLNRDHLALAAAETRNLHRFVRAWRPDLILDVHTYPPRREQLLASGLVHCHDVLVDFPTNPAVADAPHGAAAQALAGHLIESLTGLGYRAGRYVLVRPGGRVRHSTPEIIDARNGLALRYGVPTLLLEGRQRGRGEPAEAPNRTVAALRAAVSAVVRWAADHQDRLTAQRSPFAPGEGVAVRGRFARSVAPYTMAFRDADSGAVYPAELPGRYSPAVTPTRRVRLPAAYAVPASDHSTLDVLTRHGFPVLRPEASSGRWEVERLRFEGGRPRRPKVAVVRETLRLDGYAVFPVGPDGGRALAVLLEPGSKYGLFGKLPGVAPRPGEFYPVVRVIESFGSPGAAVEPGRSGRR